MVHPSFFDQLLLTNNAIDLFRVETIWASLELKGHHSSFRKDGDLDRAIEIVTFLHSRHSNYAIDYTNRLLESLSKDDALGLDKLSRLPLEILKSLVSDTTRKNKVRAFALSIGLLNVPSDMNTMLRTPSYWEDSFRFIVQHINNGNPQVHTWITSNPETFKKIVKSIFAEDLGIPFWKNTELTLPVRHPFAFQVSELLIPVITKWDPNDDHKIQEWRNTLASIKWKSTYDLANVAVYWIYRHNDELKNPYIQELFCALFKKDPSPTLHDAPKTLEQLWYNHNFSWLPQSIADQWIHAMVSKTYIDKNAPQYIVKQAIEKQILKAQACVTPQEWVWTEILNDPDRIEKIQDEDVLLRILKPWHKKVSTPEFKVEGLDGFLNSLSKLDIPLHRINKMLTTSMLSKQIVYMFLSIKDQLLTSDRRDNPWREIEKIKNIVNYVQAIHPSLSLEKTIHTLSDSLLSNKKVKNIQEISNAIDQLWSALLTHYPKLSDLESMFENLANAGLVTFDSKVDKEEFIVQQLHNHQPQDVLESKKEAFSDVIGTLE